MFERTTLFLLNFFSHPAAWAWSFIIAGLVYGAVAAQKPPTQEQIDEIARDMPEQWSDGKWRDKNGDLLLSVELTTPPKQATQDYVAEYISDLRRNITDLRADVVTLQKQLDALNAKAGLPKSGKLKSAEKYVGQPPLGAKPPEPKPLKKGRFYPDVFGKGVGEIVYGDPGNAVPAQPPEKPPAFPHGSPRMIPSRALPHNDILRDMTDDPYATPPAMPPLQNLILSEETKALIGERAWHLDAGHIHPTTGQNVIYIAISVDEARVIKPRLYRRNQVGSKATWYYAFEDHVIVSAWHRGRAEPFYALRWDYFQALQDDIAAVHKGKLPSVILKEVKK
jgi:hypothetical protein